MKSNQEVFNITIEDLIESNISGIHKVKADHGAIVKQIYDCIPAHDVDLALHELKEYLAHYSRIYAHLQYIFARLLEYNKGRRVTIDIDNLIKAIEALAKATKHQYDSLSRKITIDQNADGGMNRR